MEAYVLDWLNMLLRWAHVITGIAWIGASFYFVGLDNGLLKPADPKDIDKGVGGETWAVHGGGFYHQQKYARAPARLPEHLHWSFWESYSTWLTGFTLFTVLYLFNPGTFLIDKTVHDWSPAAAVVAALGFLVAFWVIYDAICRLFGTRKNGDLIVGALVFVFVVFAAWLSCALFAGRAAFLLVGAMLATTMSANVFFWIIPGQREDVAALRAGQAVNPANGQRGKQRSVHNTYFTLPVVFTMLSNHYGFLYSGANNWVVLVVMMLAGALIRLSFVLRHKALAEHRPVPWRYAIMGCVVLAGLVVALAPQPRAAAAASSVPTTPVSYAEVRAVIDQRCALCHNEQVQNKNVALHTPALLKQHAQAVYQQASVLKLMPMNNATQITDDERALIKRWFEAGAPTH
jgi:uncharacterized membrane protein